MAKLSDLPVGTYVAVDDSRNKVTGRGHVCAHVTGGGVRIDLNGGGGKKVAEPRYCTVITPAKVARRFLVVTERVRQVQQAKGKRR